MENIDVLRMLAGYHNRIVDINVKGDSAIIMGQLIVDMRSAIARLQNDVNSTENGGECG